MMEARLMNSPQNAVTLFAAPPMDASFADYVKLPATVLRITDTEHIQPRVPCVPEALRIAVNGCNSLHARGRSITLVGCATMVVFAILPARTLGSGHIITTEANPTAISQAEDNCAAQFMALSRANRASTTG